MTDDYDDMKQRWHGVPPEEPEDRPEDKDRINEVFDRLQRTVFFPTDAMTPAVAQRQPRNGTSAHEARTVQVVPEERRLNKPCQSVASSTTAARVLASSAADVIASKEDECGSMVKAWIDRKAP